jgi:16S rRNA C1402 N4-methylase RsmH
MLPNVLQPDTTDHVPVLADEVRALLALEPGHTLVDGTFGAGVTRRCSRATSMVTAR